ERGAERTGPGRRLVEGECWAGDRDHQLLHVLAQGLSTSPDEGQTRRGTRTREWDLPSPGSLWSSTAGGSGSSARWARARSSPCGSPRARTTRSRPLVFGAPLLERPAAVRPSTHA